MCRFLMYVQLNYIRGKFESATDRIDQITDFYNI